MEKLYIINYDRLMHHTLYFGSKIEALKKYMELLVDSDVENLKFSSTEKSKEKDITKEINEFLGE